MRRTLPLLFALTTACASAPAPQPAPQPAPEPTAVPAHVFTTEQITFTATARNARGHNDFEYRYTLAEEGSLRFGAYYFNFPIEMNHNDSVEWNAGAHAPRVFAAANAVLADPARLAELCEVPEEGETVAHPCAEPAPGAPVFTLSARLDGHTSSWRAMQPESAAFQALERAFRVMTQAFEAETQRPLAREALPQ